jgi:hypothetical protein
LERATFLLLHATGAKSDQPRLAPLAYSTIGSTADADTNLD